MNDTRKIRTALCGLGSAGRSRLKALEAVDGLELRGLVSQRSGIGTRSWADVLNDRGIDAIAISTENTRHARLTREALEAGKHVLCDYPLAFARSEAEDLLGLAERKGLILHVEHIGLLTSSHANATHSLTNLGTLRTGEYHFEGGWSEKWSNPAFTGPLPFITYSRLLQVAEWFGTFKVTSSEFRADARDFFLHLQLQFSAGGRLDFFEVRAPERDRRRWMDASLTRGPFSWHPHFESEGLFGKDLEHFRDRIISKAPPYYRQELMLLCLEILEKIS